MELVVHAEDSVKKEEGEFGHCGSYDVHVASDCISLGVFSAKAVRQCCS